jgi:hypothetical protein
MHSSAATSIIQFIVNELVHVDEIQSGISPNLLVRNWPPAFREWSTKAVRDAFFASPLFPRLLNPDAIKETIARGVSNGQLAYVGKTASGKYHPFSFERQSTRQMSKFRKRCLSSPKRPLRLTARTQRGPRAPRRRCSRPKLAIRETYPGRDGRD